MLARLLVLIAIALPGSAWAEPALVLTGNTTFTTTQIRTGTQPREVPLVDASGAIDVDAVRHQHFLIETFYREHGYLQVNVDDPEIDHGKRRIAIRIFEGPRFTLASIRVTGRLIESERRVMALLGLRRGDTATCDAIVGALAKVQTFYRRRGYELVTLRPTTTIGDRTVALTIEVDPGVRTSRVVK